jgi:hypothetical protein
LAFSRVGKFLERLLQAIRSVSGRQAGVMSVNRVGDEGMAVGGRVGSASGPVVDSVNAWVAETGLKAGGVFPQIMQQAGEAGFGGGLRAHRCGEFLGEVGDVAQVVGERLPFAGRLGEAAALGIFGGVGVGDHARCGGFMRMILAEGVGQALAHGLSFSEKA